VSLSDIDESEVAASLSASAFILFLRVKGRI